MKNLTRLASLRLPKTFTYTALHVAVAGTLACSSTGSTQPPADASASDTTNVTDSAMADVTVDSTTADSAAQDTGVDTAPADVTTADSIAMQDSPTDSPPDAFDCDAGLGGILYCGPAIPDASCPGPICTTDMCPFDAGCTLFA